MSERFEDKAFGSVGIEANRNRSNEFANKETPKPTKPDETQDTEVTREITVLINGKRYAILDDGDLEIRNKLNGMGISIQQNGDIMMLSGSGGNGKACGGRFIVNAKGGQLAKYGGPVVTEATASPKSPTEGEGSDTTETSATDKLACSNLYYGDAITECHGELRLRATKVVIEAADVLSLIGKSKVLIQAGPSGGGEIQLNAGKIKQTCDTSVEEVLGQKSTTVAEKTDLQFDPRASVNIISPGHVNWQILGDYQQNVGGVSKTIVAGAVLSTPLVEDRLTSFSVDALLGNMNFTSVVGNITQTATAGALTQTAGAAVTTAAGGALTQTAGAAVTVIGGGDVGISSGLGAVSIEAKTNVEIEAEVDVRISGALIYLN